MSYDHNTEADFAAPEMARGLVVDMRLCYDAAGLRPTTTLAPLPPTSLRRPVGQKQTGLSRFSKAAPQISETLLLSTNRALRKAFMVS
jgi:hypothetical protein